MNRRIIAGAAALVMVMGGAVCPAEVITESFSLTASAEDYQQEGDIYYEVFKGGKYIVVRGLANADAAEVVIPDKIDGVPVTVIGEKAFYECEGLTSVTLPETIENIEIGAFDGCTALAEINFPSSLKSIGASAFYNAGLKSIDLPEGLEIIGTYAFSACPGITVFTIPKSVKEIGDKAIGCYFDGNYKKYSNFIIKCYSNTAGENYAYDGWFDYDLVDPDNALNVPVNGGICNKSFRYEIVEGGSRIKVTSGHKRLSEIEIPAQIGDIPVTEIGEDAFNEYENLTKIDIPATVDTFGNNAFCDCTNLTEIKIPKATKTIGDSAFENTGLTEVDLPEGLETIGSYAFFSNEKMTAVDIPLSVKEIGEKAFGYDSDDYKSDNFYITCFEDTAGEDYMNDNGFDGNVKQQPYLRGDINNDHTVTVTDISMAAGHVKAIKELNEVEFKRADVSGDDVVNVTDISMIAAHVKAIKEL